jgi:hypothetical protein
VSAVHAIPSLQLRAGPPHTPAVQVSPVVQYWPSSQEVPLMTGAWLHPSIGSQVSTVHEFSSSHGARVPSVQNP